MRIQDRSLTFQPHWSIVPQWQRFSHAPGRSSGGGSTRGRVEQPHSETCVELTDSFLAGTYLRLVGRPGSSVELTSRTDSAQVGLRAPCRLDSQGIHCSFLPGVDSSEARDLRIEVDDEHGDILRIETFSADPMPVGASQGRRYPVCIGLATIPARAAMLERVVNRLCRQCDHMFVYLNGFPSIPGFLRREGLTVIRSQDFGDYRDNSKFFGLQLLDRETYFLTVDDDIDYPEDYVESLVGAIERFDRKAVIGFHGAIYGAGSRHFRDRLVLHFQDELDLDLPVNVLGTGTVGFHSATFRPNCLSFTETGMADLIVGAALSSLDIPAIVAARRSGFMRGFEHEKGAITLFDEAQVIDSPHDRFIAATTWRLAGTEPAQAGSPWHRADPFKRFERAVRNGQDPSQIELPWSPQIVAVAHKLRLRPLALACAKGRLKNLTGFLLACEADGGGRTEGGGHDSTFRQLALGCIRAFREPAAPGNVGGDAEASAIDQVDALDALMADQWMEVAADDVDPGLTLCYAAAQVVFSDGPIERARFLRAACAAYNVDLVDRLAAQHASLGTLGEEQLGPLARVRLRTGAVEEVVASASELCAAGWAGQVLLATAGAASGAPWANVLAHQAFMALPRPRAARQLRDLAAMLRSCGADVLNLPEFARQVPRMPGAAQLEACSILLAGGVWNAEIDLHALPIESPTERALWHGRAADVVAGSNEAAMTALNRVFLSQGMVPVYLREEAGSFYERLATPTTRCRMEGSFPKVSVIMAAYDAGHTIRYALESVLNQSYPNIEVVIVDDCSEQPLDLSWMEQERIPVSVVRLKTNRGPYVCRNVAIARSSGELITTHDADDWLHPQKIERQVAALRDSPSVAAYSRHVRLTARGVLAFENNGRFVGDGPVTSMFRRSAIDRMGGFLDVRTRGDVEFKARLGATFGVGKIIESTDVTLLALECPSTNSKRTLKTWRDELALARFKQKYALEHPLRLLQPYLGLPGASAETA